MFFVMPALLHYYPEELLLPMTAQLQAVSAVFYLRRAGFRRLAASKTSVHSVSRA